MKNNGLPQPTKFQKFGGSIYLKIPKDRYKHLEIKDMLKEKTKDQRPAECQAEKNEQGEKYISAWNPEAESQTGGE